MKRHLAKVLLPGFLLLTQTWSAAAQSAMAVISIGSDSGNPGDTVVVPISLSSQGGAQVAGVNFTLSFDGSRLAVSQIDTGSAASAAGKSVSWSPMPTCTGSCSIIVAGLNQNVISDGVIAQVHFNVLSGASSGTSPLTLGSAVATNPSATPIPASVSNGSFQVITPTNTPTPISTNTNTPTPSNTPTPTYTPIPPTSTNSATPGPSPTASRTPTPSKTSPPTATHTPGPSPTPSATPTGTLTPSATGSLTASETATRTATSGGAGEGLELEGAAAATGTALAEFEGAVAATSTALAEEVAARPTDQIVSTGPSTGALQRPELFIACGLLLFALLLGSGAGYLIWRRQRAGAG